GLSRARARRLGQPVAVRNDRTLSLIVSGLLFTMAPHSVYRIELKFSLRERGCAALVSAYQRDPSMTPVLVTGGAGFIGSHTCKALRNAGFSPVSYDDLSRGNAEAVKWGELVIASIADGRLLRDTLLRHRPVAVVHFAAFAYVGESTENPGLYYRNNVVGTLALLKAMRECGVRYLVFSSSCAVYGVPPVVPIQENTPLNPVNPYGATKM